MRADSATLLRVHLPIAADLADEAVAERILFALFRGTLVIGQAVCITILQGQVVLSGSVGSDRGRAAVENTLQGLPGVVGITNLITINAEGCISSSTGALFEQDSRDSIAGQTEARIIVVDGRVDLRGTVGSAREYDLIKRVAWAVPGVASIDDQIALSQTSTPC